MTESRNRSRKVTRKSGSPEARDAAPVFQAPDANTTESADTRAAHNADAGDSRNHSGEKHTEKSEKSRNRIILSGDAVVATPTTRVAAPAHAVDVPAVAEAPVETVAMVVTMAIAVTQ